jgi:hypothetical protein
VTRLFISPELNNFYGQLQPVIRRRLSQVHTDPRKYWSRDHGIILRADGEHLTLWQAVIKTARDFPREGPSAGQPWPRYPTPEEIEAALLYAAPARTY